MSSQAYKQITNLTAFVAIIAILAYDHLGSYGWIGLSLAAIAAIIAGVSYLKLHWGQREPNKVPQSDTLSSEILSPPDPACFNFSCDIVHLSGKDAASVQVHFVYGGGIAPASLDRVLSKTRLLREQRIAYLLTELEKHEWDAATAAEKLRYASLAEEISRRHITVVSTAISRKSGLQSGETPFGLSAKAAAKAVRHPEIFAIPCTR